MQSRSLVLEASEWGPLTYSKVRPLRVHNVSRYCKWEINFFVANRKKDIASNKESYVLWSSYSPEYPLRKSFRRFAETIFRFGVLQLRVDGVEIVHLRVIASEVYYFNILQDNVRALFILQAKVGRVLVGQCRLLWLEVEIFRIIKLRTHRRLTLEPELPRRLIQ
jgi:hypothetical protein